MTTEIDRDILMEAVKKAQERIAEIDSGAVQTIPGDEDANFFIANQEYPVWSPHNCSEAANVLMNLLATKQQEQNG